MIKILNYINYFLLIKYNIKINTTYTNINTNNNTNNNNIDNNFNINNISSRTNVVVDRSFSILNLKCLGKIKEKVEK